jgi:hypothetical protein
VVKPRTIINAILLIGISCLGLAMVLAIVPAFESRVEVHALISTLSDGFKLCLGALLALLNDHTRRSRR